MPHISSACQLGSSCLATGSLQSSQLCPGSTSPRATNSGAALQDDCGNQVEVQENQLEGLRLSVTGAVKEDGEPSQMQELLADAQVTLMLHKHHLE